MTDISLARRRKGRRPLHTSPISAAVKLSIPLGGGGGTNEEERKETCDEERQGRIIKQIPSKSTLFLFVYYVSWKICHRTIIHYLITIV